uniref:Uncharacterized protein n=1 Tax=Zea mays TaxID=4577 RepID=C0HGN3_MAIZE|nr:unknown [Zea mays]ACN32118.1 unknown [Zea mays]|eukprot:NP_001169260.1 uncharacterized protein LOC100383123 [Zea mays]
MAPPAGAGTEGRPAQRRGTGTSPGRTKVWVEPPGKSRDHHQPPRAAARPPLPLWLPRASAARAADHPFPTVFSCRALPRLPARPPLPTSPAATAEVKEKDSGQR